MIEIVTETQRSRDKHQKGKIYRRTSMRSIGKYKQGNKIRLIDWK